LSSPINGNHAPARATALLVGPSRSKRAIILALVLTLLMTAGGFWWMCDRNEAIAFLPARAGADWILFPRQAETTTHDAVSVTVEYRHSFTLNTKPAHATLAICAFKGATVAINSRQVSDTPFTRPNWKLGSSAEVADLLQPGTNVITAWVTNAVGPPALWLLLKSDQLSLGTSEQWQASLPGTGWQSAARVPAGGFTFWKQDDDGIAEARVARGGCILRPFSGVDLGCKLVAATQAAARWNSPDNHFDEADLRSACGCADCPGRSVHQQPPPTQSRNGFRC